jgi:thiol-disulfide isomerase/thioredoxin
MLKSLKYYLIVALIASHTTLAQADAVKLPTKIDISAIEGSARLTRETIKDKKVLIQFWASWCVGCSKVMEELIPITKGTDKTQYLSISLDETKDQAKGYFKFQNDNVKKLLPSSWIDPDTSLANSLSIKSLPALFLIDSNGTVIENMYGHPSAEQMKKIEDFFK